MNKFKATITEKIIAYDKNNNKQLKAENEYKYYYEFDKNDIVDVASEISMYSLMLQLFFECNDKAITHYLCDENNYNYCGVNDIWMIEFMTNHSTYKTNYQLIHQSKDYQLNTFKIKIERIDE